MSRGLEIKLDPEAKRLIQDFIKAANAAIGRTCDETPDCLAPANYSIEVGRSVPRNDGTDWVDIVYDQWQENDFCPWCGGRLP